VPELAPPNEQWKAHAQVLDAIERTVLAQGWLELQLRQQLAALITDMPAAYIAYGPDALALQLGQSPQTVRRWVEEARMFCDYPVLLGLVNDGTWTPKHADAVLDEIQILPVDLQDDAIALVLQRDDARTPYELRRAARAAVMVLDLDAASKRADKTRKDRRVTFTDNGHGGAAAIVDGPTSSLAMLSAALDAHALPRQAGDARSLDQRRFDTLIDLVCGRLVPGNWQAHVLVTLATLEGGNELAEIPGFGLITAGEARELLAHADLQRVVLDEHGQLVSIDRRTFHPDNPGADAGAGEATLFDPQQTVPPDPAPGRVVVPTWLLTDQDEPFPDLLQEHDLVELDAAVPDSDRAWVLSELHAAWQDAAFEAFVADAMSHLDTEVHSYLDAHALIHAHALVHAHAPAHPCGHLPRTTGTGAQGTGSDAPLPRDEPNSLRPPPDEPRHQPDPPPGAPEDLDNPADPEDPDDPGRSGGSRRPHPPPGSPDQPGPLSPDPTVEPSVIPTPRPRSPSKPGRTTASPGSFSTTGSTRPSHANAAAACAPKPRPERRCEDCQPEAAAPGPSPGSSRPTGGCGPPHRRPSPTPATATRSPAGSPST
jgi:hypothetical protein